MKAKVFFISLALAFALCSCTKSELDPRFIEEDTVRLVVSGSEVFRYNELSCQMSYNSGRREFRVHTDNMSDYFILTLSKIPSSTNQETEGGIVWNTASGSGRANSTAFKAVKLEGGKIWLWDAADNISVVVTCL